MNNTQKASKLKGQYKKTHHKSHSYNGFCDLKCKNIIRNIKTPKQIESKTHTNLYALTSTKPHTQTYRWY